jgi:hypothetical protein
LTAFAATRRTPRTRSRRQIFAAKKFVRNVVGRANSEHVGTRMEAKLCESVTADSATRSFGPRWQAD